MKRLFSLFSFSVRTKLILGMVLISLLSTAIIGGTAYLRLTHKFDQMVMQDSIKGFRNDVSAYFHVYGTWEEGQRREGFRQFVERRREEKDFSLRRSSFTQSAFSQEDSTIREHRPLDENRGDESRPNDNIHIGPNRPNGPNNNRVDQFERPPLPMGPPRGNNEERPPFRFYLFDLNFNSLVKLPPYRPGQPAMDSERAKLLPIESDGRVVAYFSPQGQINYSDQDLSYLAAMREALTTGAAVAVTMALILGVIFGTSLSRALRKLTLAVQAMGQGDLKQRVLIESADEVGILARAFNRMSKDLSNQYEALRDSHERIEEMAEELRELSIRDALTGLHNRRYFDEQCDFLVKHATRYQRPLSVVLADIDHFKKINDTFSHGVGDQVLRRIGSILGSKTRASDLVARYGGEEFVIALPETDNHQAHEISEALRKRVEAEPWHEIHPQLQVSLSIGLFSSASGAADYQSMLKVADERLYQAKSAGRNRVCSA